MRLALALVFFLIGAAPAALGGWIIAERVQWSQSGRQASAEVVEAKRLWLRDLLSPLPRTDYYEVTYAFRTPGGDLVRASGTTSQGRHISRPRPGSKLRVYYDPDEPSSSVPVDDNRVFEALVLIGFGVLVWIGSAAAWKRLHSRRRLQGERHGT